MTRTKTYELTGYITNLGKYVEGYLIGKYISFPITKAELSTALEEIGINDTYEEWFFTDYDGEYPTQVYDMLGEYTSIKELNKIALALERVSDEGVTDLFEAFLDNGKDFYSACANAIEGNGWFISGDDYTDLATFIIDACGGFAELSQDSIEEYLDVEALGRDIRLEYCYYDDMPETAGEYWCGDENATDEEIGQAYIDECGYGAINNKDNYFDYARYGEAIYDEGEFVFTENGIVDCGDFDDSLGEEFKEELEETYNEREEER